MLNLLAIIFPFLCRHAAGSLHVRKPATSVESGDGLHNIVTYHLYCTCCNKDVKIEYAELNETARKNIFG
jgi:hypothetical protein